LSKVNANKIDFKTFGTVKNNMGECNALVETMVEMGDLIDWTATERMFVALSSIPDARMACHGVGNLDSQCHEFARRMNGHLGGYSMRSIGEYAIASKSKWFAKFAKGKSADAAARLRKCGR
jgi:hypothetical protein